MRYINIANGYLCFRRLQVWKAKHWETEYIEHFPNHFPQGPWPCHMLGGCRSSLETSVQHDGWHALADTLGHLIFVSWVFLGHFLLRFIHKKKLQYECRGLHCFWKMLQSCLAKGLDGGKMARFVEREAVPQSVLCGNLLRRSTDGWEGNLNVISWGLRLDP